MSKEEAIEALNIVGYEMSGILTELRYYNDRGNSEKVGEVLENKMRVLVGKIADIVTEEQGVD